MQQYVCTQIFKYMLNTGIRKTFSQRERSVFIHILHLNAIRRVLL